MNSNSQIQFSEDKKSRLKLGEQMAILAMPPKEQRKLVKSIGSEVRKDARQNIRKQKTISGAPMAKRKDARNKRKLLRKMGKGMVVFNRGNTKAIVTWKNSRSAQIANSQQKGSRQAMTASKAAKRGSKPDYDAPVTRDMAKALIQEGYRQPVKGKNGRSRLKKVSQRWIMDNMTQGQAGLVLKELRNAGSKRSWTIRTPARPFLGATEQDADKMLESMAKAALARIQSKK